jgi:cell division septal protein FtsQ
MKKILLALVTVVLIGFGCQSSKENQEQFMVADMEMDIPITRQEVVPPPPAMASEFFSKSNPTPEQKLIKTVRIGIEVNQFNLARKDIDSLIRINSAWVSNEYMYNTDYQISSNITVRVPSERLDVFSNQVIAISKKVNFQNTETQDVTEEFIDVESRLKNQRTLEQKFISLLRRTDSIEEIIKIETKLNEIRSDIESFEGRLKYLGNRVQFSTVNLEVSQRIDYKFIPEPMESFWERFKNSLHKGWMGFVAFLLFLIKLWPLWLILSVLVFIVLKYRSVRFKKVKLGGKKKGKEKSSSKDKKADKSVSQE